MKHIFLALSLALALSPAAVLAADDSAPPAPPQMTQAQRQNMMKTFEAYRQKEDALHAQLRTQILGSLTAAHRTAVANLIGQLAISSNPDPAAAARQLDALLSPGERQAIVNAHASFGTQSKALHEQMRAQMEQTMPPGGPGQGMHGAHEGMGGPMDGSMNGHRSSGSAQDAGTLVLMILSPHPMGGMMGMMHHFGPPGGPPHR